MREYDAEVMKKTQFFTKGDHLDLILLIEECLNDMDVSVTLSESAVKFKFDVTPTQVKKIFAEYVWQLNSMRNRDFLTATQKTLLESQQAQDILNGQEEFKEEDAVETCTIEILGVSQQVYCVDFSYKEKAGKKLDVTKKYQHHFKAWKTLLSAWNNITLEEI